MNNKTITLPMTENEWDSAGMVSNGSSLMTSLGLIEGDILNLVESKGAMVVRDVVRQILWPVPLVLMGIGALIRQGLLKSSRDGYSIMLEERSK